MAKFGSSGLGKTILVFLTGTALLSIVYNFWIAPYLFSGYTITTFAQFLSGLLAFQMPALGFLLLVLAWWLGYIGIGFARRGKR